MHAAVVGEGDVAGGGEAGFADCCSWHPRDFGVVVFARGGVEGGQGSDAVLCCWSSSRAGGRGRSVAAVVRCWVHQPPCVGLGGAGGSGVRCARLELEAGLGRELGGGLVELLPQRFDHVRVGALVVGGQVVSGVGDVVGQP